MGGVFGHMSHIYDNPYMTFGQIKDIMEKASAGELRGTEKTDGQNLFVSYNINDGTVRAARNKGNIKAGGLTPAELLAKFEGRGALTDAFVDAFASFERAVETFSDEEKLDLFGPDTNVYYNAEVMDPGSANVINYDKKTFLVHRAGAAAYDRETGKPSSEFSGKDFSEQQAQKLQGALEKVQNDSVQEDFKIQVNAIRNLESLDNDNALQIALIKLGRFMMAKGVDDQDSIGSYIVESLDDLVKAQLSPLRPGERKRIVSRIMEDYYGVIEGEPGPKKVRGLETRQIIKDIDKPELNDEIKRLISNYPKYLKLFIFPLEDIIHDFTVEMLRGLQSVFILDNKLELHRQRKEVETAIKAIESSGSEEAMEILRTQMDKLKNLEGVSSAAEGFVFDYDGNTYKFTGGFAPMNQILGLFKYGRKGIPALAEGAEEAINNVALYPGKFKPPHGGHFNVAKSVLENRGVNKLIVFVSPIDHEGISPQQAVDIWNIYRNYLPGDVDIRIANVTPVRSVYDYIDNEAERGDDLHLILGEKDVEGGRFSTAANRRKEINVAEVPIPPQMGGVSATQMRSALRSDDDEAFIAGLPNELNDSDINAILGVLKNGLDETSGSGAAGGYSIGLGMIPRQPPVAGSEKKRNSRSQNFLPTEELVNEVVDYLLGISVG
tara:strand:+ start:2152 stop:4146 length:1995 start_codon:yes stop_codon:yes gene_type:complete